jgi:hypothetical protein
VLWCAHQSANPGVQVELEEPRIALWILTTTRDVIEWRRRFEPRPADPRYTLAVLLIIVL